MIVDRNAYEAFLRELPAKHLTENRIRTEFGSLVQTLFEGCLVAQAHYPKGAAPTYVIYPQRES